LLRKAQFWKKNAGEGEEALSTEGGVEGNQGVEGAEGQTGIFGVENARSGSDVSGDDGGGIPRLTPASV
jgi:hypothetical protein